MIIPIIPKDITLAKVDELSPSRYTWLTEGCPYSMLLETTLRAYKAPCLTLPPLGGSYNNVIGTIIHSVYQEVNNGTLENNEEAITRYWNKKCEEYKQKIIAAYPSLRSVSVCDYDAMFDTIGVLSSLTKELSSTEASGSKIKNPNEHWIKLPGLLRGSIDRIRYNADGYEIVDYKTGKIYGEDGKIKPEYVTQLNLYAFMLEEDEGVVVNKLTIIDRKGDEINVPYHKASKAESLKSVKETIDGINKAIDDKETDSLKRGNEKTCGFCPCRHLCDRRIIAPGAPLSIVEGTVIKVWNSDQISIQTKDGNQVTISKLKVLNIDDMDNLVGKYLILANVQMIQENALYSRCDTTVIFEKEL